MPDAEEMAWIGAAIVSAQRVEFGLYGIVSHLSHLPQAQQDRRFRSITPETFLRGDLRKLKATLGQMVELFGGRLLISTPDLMTFYEDRNLIAHNYYREFHAEIRGRERRVGGLSFLKEFVERSAYWSQVLSGLLNELRLAAATKEGRLSEFAVTPEQEASMRAYRAHAEKYLISRL